MSAADDPVLQGGDPTLEDRAGAQARNGWGPLPLPTGKKAMPPVGFTGGQSPMPSYADWYTVYIEQPARWGNLGARIPKGVVGVDVDAYDGKNGSSTWRSIGGPGFPETVALSSRFGPGYDGASGIRLYRLPDGVDEADLWGAHDGIEILRHSHRYAVSPGSTHPNGSIYQAFDVPARAFLDVLPPVESLPVLTVEQARMLTNAGAPWAGDSAIGERPRDENPQCAYTARLLNRALGGIKNEDSRYGTMSSAVWALVNGEDEGHHLGEALDILKLAYIAAAGKDRREAGHEPPASEFDRNAADAYRKVGANPTDPMLKQCCATATLPDEPKAQPTEDDDVPEETAYDREVKRQYLELRIREDARTLLAEHQVTGAKPLTPVGLGDFLSTDFGPERYRVTDLWPAEGRVLLAAAAKAGKTTLVACNLIPSLVDGTPFLSPKHDVTPVAGTVVYLNMEVGERTIQRWFADAGIGNLHKVVVLNLRGSASALTIGSPRGRKRVASVIRDCGGEVAILDPLAPMLASLGLDENSNSDVAKFFGYWSEVLNEAGIVDDVVVHHTGHAGDRSRGASRLLDEPDAVWTLTKDQAGEGEDALDDVFAGPVTRYLQAFGRDVEMGAEELSFDPETRLLSLTGTSKSRSRKQSRDKSTHEQIKSLLRDQKPRSKTAISQDIVGMASNAKLPAVQTFIETGHLYDSGMRANSSKKDPSSGVVLYLWRDDPR
jgi:hypothetical protein